MALSPEALFAIDNGARGQEWARRVTQGDVAAALSFMQKAGDAGETGYLLALFLFRNDFEVIPRLKILVGRVVDRHWYPTHETKNITMHERRREAYTNVALYEMAHPVICPVCRGQCQLYDNIKEEFYDCEFCACTGFKRMSHAERGRIAGLPEKTAEVNWYNNYRKAYEPIFREITMLTSQVVNNLAFRICGRR